MKALILTGRLCQPQELMYPYYRMQEAGFEVDVASRGAAEFETYGGLKFAPSRDLPINSEVTDYELLVLPGGVKAMEHMRLDEQVVSFITSYHRAGGVIGSICSGAQLLISAGLVKGRVISAYPAMAIDVENAGGTWHPGPVVNFDRIISSPHYRNLPDFMKELLKAVDSEKAWRNQVHHV
jgi:protease I